MCAERIDAPPPATCPRDPHSPPTLAWIISLVLGFLSYLRWVWKYSMALMYLFNA